MQQLLLHFVLCLFFIPQMNSRNVKTTELAQQQQCTLGVNTSTWAWRCSILISLMENDWGKWAWLLPQREMDKCKSLSSIVTMLPISAGAMEPQNTPHWAFFSAARLASWDLKKPDPCRLLPERYSLLFSKENKLPLLSALEIEPSNVWPQSWNGRDFVWIVRTKTILT